MSIDTIRTIEWKDDKVVMLDQRQLPLKEVYVTYDDYLSVANAIKSMVIRGAPAIGVAAAMGVALGAMGIGVRTFEEFYEKLGVVCRRLTETRPTAVNLMWAVERMRTCALAYQHQPLSEIVGALKQEALTIYHEDIEANRRMGRAGQTLLNDGDHVLTHCNAGALATAGFGTALGVIYAATEAGKCIHVYADETRPRLQGASLTAWELQKHGIQVTVITDTMAASIMKQGKIQKVIVGADRIAANGDTANKIGTYGVALMAHYHKIPFYVAAPMSTIDPKLTDGSQVPIEERDPREVTHIGQHRITPEHVDVINPAFDVTPAEFITAIITDCGIVTAPFTTGISSLLAQK